MKIYTKKNNCNHLIDQPYFDWLELKSLARDLVGSYRKAH